MTEAPRVMADGGSGYPITEEWLKGAGFKWSQFDRQPDKHWTLWLGWAIEDNTTCVEDVGLELAPGRDGTWFCWFRSDTAGRYSRFLHIRHLRWWTEIAELIAAIVGRPFDPAHAFYGHLLTPERAKRQREENERLDRRLMRNGYSHHAVEKDETMGGAGVEHLREYEDRRSKKP